MLISMKRMFAWLLSSSVFLAPLAAAADLPQPYRYGFSPDGAYHLMLTRWTQDGSGFPAAHLRVVRQGVGVMLEDRLIMGTGSGGENQTPQQVAEALLARHAARLAELGLSAPAPGQPLWAQAVPQPALSGWPQQEAQLVSLPTAVPGGVGSIEVRPQAVFNTCEMAGMLTQEPLGLRLRVNGQDWFRDSTRLPAGRACVTAYRLEAAWQQGNAVAVLLRAYSPGFEGPDALPLTLLGRVNVAAVSVPAAPTGQP